MEKELSNAVLTLTRNNLELTKRCIDSVFMQDVPVKMYVFDNGSTDGTREWLEEHPETITSYIFEANYGVSRGWNFGLTQVFDHHDHCLVIGNDTILGSWTYSALLSLQKFFVTGVDVGMSELPKWPDIFPLSPHPDFSCFLISRECWEAVGEFDTRMVSYAGDCDYHIRAHRVGIPLWKASVPYNHERSSTMNRATAKERMLLQHQANRDRAAFRDIYQCLPGTKEYDGLFKEVAK
jgi:GT2 family glycosyltransferase